MIQGLIAKKIGMSQQFDDAGNVVPVTVLKAGPCTVIQKKTADKDGYVAVQRPSDERLPKSLHGLTRTLINNAIKGVTVGYEDILDISGVGYKAEVKGKILNMALGFSHPVDFPIPEGITAEVEKGTRITLRGVDKHLVGMTAAQIRIIRKTEPYKGKGIKYATEKVRRKVGKQGAV